MLAMLARSIPTVKGKRRHPLRNARTRRPDNAFRF